MLITDDDGSVSGSDAIKACSSRPVLNIEYSAHDDEGPVAAVVTCGSAQVKPVVPPKAAR